MISTSQPQDIVEAVARYNKEREASEANLMDLILVSGGAVSWTELMSMPLPSVKIMTERLNKQTEDRNNAIAKKSRGR